MPTGRGDWIVLLGTADGLANPKRNHAALLARLDGKTILLDAGQPCSQTLKRLGIGLDELDGIVITHTHTDHVGGLPMLLQSAWLEGRQRALPIWLPPQAIRPLRIWLRACYLFSSRLGFVVRWLPIRGPIRIGTVRICAIRNSHLDETRARFGKRYPDVGYDAFSLVVESRHSRFAYSSDIGAVADLEPLCRKPLGLLITELAHIEAGELGEFLRTRPIGRVVLTHVGRGQRGRVPGAIRAHDGDIIDLRYHKRIVPA